MNITYIQGPIFSEYGCRSKFVNILYLASPEKDGAVVCTKC